MIENTVNSTVDSYFGIHNETENVDEFLNYLRTALDVEYDLGKGKSPEKIKEEITDLVLEKYKQKEEEIGAEQLRELERIILLRTVDAKWMDHLDDLEQLKQGIGLMAYGQKDPAVEYKIQGFEMFGYMIQNIKEDTVKTLYHIQVEQNVEREEVAKVTGTNKDDTVSRGPVKKAKKIGRNDLCPCGSGKKYKNCHGQGL